MWYYIYFTRCCFKLQITSQSSYTDPKWKKVRQDIIKI